MTEYKDRELNDPSDIDLNDDVQDGMQGASGNMDANGLEPGADREEKLDELRENLGSLTGTPDAGLPGPADTE